MTYKNAFASCLIALFISNAAFAGPAASPTANDLSETISNIEKALVEVNHSDFSEAHLHIKTARASADKITQVDPSKLKAAIANIVQGQIQANHGNVKESAELLSKALEELKAL